MKACVSDMDALSLGGDEELAPSLVAIFGASEKIVSKGFGKLRRIIIETDENVLVIRKKGNKYVELDVIKK